ncbi:SOS response-associated peptidase [Sphingomonas qomolangmaensis]|uniref:Abasic site processing protein n=1 Tax=Sphingomonas qomolangmaensis TaxID=2918765 RepID=A0ABY5L6Z9_9SPHN|nr:SOS response-associated peptidase family protein [Sphingomonas qomolangmaensis]UUL82222.1 SOS response-associated peptidase family protein [Sphingomonas qomolangmaensis]
MTASRAALLKRFGVIADVKFDNLPPPELFPDRRAYVVRSEGAAVALDAMQWGFPHKVPGKRIDPVTGKPKMLDRKVTNVRNLQSSFWRSALTNPERRCLVPVTSFSEYGPGPIGKKPLWWFDVPSRPIFSFAGIWRPADGGAVFAFLTTEPNSVVGPIHPKAMPVMLHDADEARWLSAPIDEALKMVAPYPSQLMSVLRAPEEGHDDVKSERGELNLFGGDSA